MVSNEENLEARESREKALLDELRQVRQQLLEAEDTLGAIRRGDVDAVVVAGPDNQPRIYTLVTADRSYRLIVEEMQEGALTLTATGDILYCNPQLAKLLALDAERIVAGSLQRFVPPEQWPVVLGMIAAQSKGESTLETPDGRQIASHLSFSALQHDDGEAPVYCCIVTDLTEQRRTGDALRMSHAALVQQVAEREKTEALLRQSQKMEAVGQLTGGVAHDFNNLLMVITGGVTMLGRALTAERQTRILEGMRQAAERGASLTRQLLAFSRQKELHPESIDLGSHLSGLRELLDRSLRGDITVKTDLRPDLWPIRVDAGEFEIALLNLCVNARDAMPQGGLITISARNHPAAGGSATPGDCVQLSVTDTGTGMSQETIARCLEPFYTTKEVGKGSGLGLAQVYGFAHGSKGSVTIESAIGRGTTVTLHLPRGETASISRRLEPDPEPTIVGLVVGKVLLVEDDRSVAELTTDLLQEIGYEVVRVDSAQGGLNLLASGQAVDVVVSDVMMPGMDGLSFAQEVRSRQRELPIILVSGFADAAKSEAQRLGIHLLSKPYSLEDLGKALRAARKARGTKQPA